MRLITLLGVFQIQRLKQVIELHYLEHLPLNIVASRPNYSFSTIKELITTLVIGSINL